MTHGCLPLASGDVLLTCVDVFFSFFCIRKWGKYAVDGVSQTRNESKSFHNKHKPRISGGESVALLVEMNIGSKTKKRVVLPSRPELPTVDQLLEDIHKAAPDDPVFSILEKTEQTSSRPADSEAELRFQQSRRYLDLNGRLEEALGRLQKQREELQTAGGQLDRTVEEVKGQVC